MVSRPALKHLVRVCLVSALIGAGCGSGDEGALDAGFEVADGDVEVVGVDEGSTEPSAATEEDSAAEESPEPVESGGDGVITFAIDGSDTYEFPGECSFETMSYFEIPNTFGATGTHEDGHHLSVARDGFEPDKPFELGSVEFEFSENPDFNPFYTTVEDTFDVTIDGDSLEVHVDFSLFFGDSEPYGDGFSATITC